MVARGNLFGLLVLLLVAGLAGCCARDVGTLAPVPDESMSDGNDPTARETLELYSEQGALVSRLRLARMLSEGRGGKRDLRRSIRLLESLVDSEVSVQASIQLINCLLFSGTEEDQARARSVYERLRVQLLSTQEGLARNYPSLHHP